MKNEGERRSEANGPSLSTCINPNDRQGRDDFSLNYRGSLQERSSSSSPRSFVRRAFFFRSISNFAIKGGSTPARDYCPRRRAIIVSAVARRFKAIATIRRCSRSRSSDVDIESEKYPPITSIRRYRIVASNIIPVRAWSNFPSPPPRSRYSSSRVRIPPRVS